MPKPFESRIQDLVYNVDVGVGLRIIKHGLYFLIILFVLLMYTATQFRVRGLDQAESMDYAQLARNLTESGRFITKCVRPATMWYLIERSERHNPRIEDHPDILHPPLYPALLAAAFRITGAPLEYPGEGVHPAEQWIMMPFGHLCTLFTGLFLFLLGRRLFERRVGLLAVTLYFVSDLVWGTSISGLNLSLSMLLCTSAFYWAVVAMDVREDGRPAPAWVGLLFLSLLNCVFAFLTRYATAVVPVAIALYLGLTLRRQQWAWTIGFLLAFIVATGPWLLRNLEVSGGILGLAPFTALNGTLLFDGDLFERSCCADAGFIGLKVSAGLAMHILVVIGRANRDGCLG
jgi:hypothetical protein